MTFLQELKHRNTQISFKVMMVLISWYLLRQGDLTGALIVQSLVLLIFIVNSGVVTWKTVFFKNSPAQTKAQIINQRSRLALQKRRIVLSFVNYLGVILLIQTVPNLIFSLLLILGFLMAEMAIHNNAFNANYKFRVLYGLEVYLMFISTMALYALVNKYYQPNLFWFLPMGILLITYFVFDYLLAKRKHRIYTTNCIYCKFRRFRQRYLVGYSLVATVIFLILWWLKIDLLLTGLVLATSLHMMRSFTCANFRASLSKEIKLSYFWILAIMILMIISTVSFSGGNVAVPDKEHSRIERFLAP